MENTAVDMRLAVLALVLALVGIPVGVLAASVGAMLLSTGVAIGAARVVHVGRAATP